MSVIDAANRFPSNACRSVHHRNDQDFVLDRLGDVLLIAEELRSSVDFGALENGSIAWAGAELDQLYTHVNEIMKKLSW